MIALMMMHIYSPAFAASKYASLVIDADTGVVLHQENAGRIRYPASLTKMMSIYVALYAVKNKTLKMSDKFKVSSKAAAQPPTKLRLRRGQRISVRKLIESLVVKSANDAAVVLAEGIAGSEWKFAMLMNRMARRLGMKNTTFRNASGLHDRRQHTTAFDMARLAVALRRDFPEYYYLFAKKKFFYNGKVYKTHNHVLKSYKGTDGLKTGYTRASGFNLVTSVQRRGQRLIGVVMGGRTYRTRDRHMKKLLDRAFAKRRGGKGSVLSGVISPKDMPEPLLSRRGSNAIAKRKDWHVPMPVLKYREMSYSVDQKLRYGYLLSVPIPNLKSDSL